MCGSELFSVGQLANAVFLDAIVHVFEDRVQRYPVDKGNLVIIDKVYCKFRHPVEKSSERGNALISSKSGRSLSSSMEIRRDSRVFISVEMQWVC